MPWFKVDDGLHSHRKAVRAGIEAMGLWMMAGSWCADQLTDGWLPDYIAARLDPNYETNAKTLVKVGLWVEETRDEEPGWSFHEWSEHQPSREQVLADRAAATDRQRRARERARERRDSERESQGRNGVTNAVSNDDRHAVTHGVSNGVTNALVTPVVTVPPTRPDPTRPDLEVQELTSVASVASLPPPDAEKPGKRGTRIPEPFIVDDGMKAWAVRRVPKVDIDHETEKFINFWIAKPGKDGVKTNWVATWHNWMLKASESIGGARSPTNHQSFQTNPARDYHGEL